MYQRDGVDAGLGFGQDLLGDPIVDGIGLQPDQRGNHGEAVGDAMVDLGQQNFGAIPGDTHLVVGLGEIGSATLHAVFKPGIEAGELIACHAQLAGVAVDGDHRGADHEDDDRAARHGDESQPPGGFALLGNGGVEAVVGGQDDAREEHIGLIHQQLAAIGAGDGERVGIPAVSLKGDALFHLGELLVEHSREAVDGGREVGIVGESGAQRFELTASL